MNIDEEVRQIVAKELGVDLALVTPDTAAGELKAWDSVRMVMILAAVQTHFGVQFPDEDLFDLVSVSALADEVRKVLAAK
ncbi:MAG: acyl carrier protein [Kiritimatiellae bacterium]|nr:acyl carrier protein [Kiritimatiellia bacterium]